MSPNPPPALPKLSPEQVASVRDRARESRLFRLLAINAYAAYSNTIVGNPAPAIEWQGQRTCEPQVGDVVLETSTVWRWARYSDEAPSDQYPGIGVLIRVVREPIPIAEGETDDGATETVHYIRPLDGTVPEYRWTNASFIRVLASLDDIKPPLRR